VRGNRRIVFILIIAGCAVFGVGLGFFGGSSKTAAGTPSAVEPARLEHLAAGIDRIVLSASAARRLGIENTAVRGVSDRGTRRKAVPYSAVVYGLHGETWTYTNPKPLVYLRHRITVDRVDRNVAVLSHGPRVGTPVVTVGAPELFGVETGIGEEH
jgi:hypothetical protein